MPRTMMTVAVKWLVAAAAATALAWTTIVAEMPWLAPGAGAHIEMAGGACPAAAKPAPLNFTVKGLDNRAVTLSDYRGKVLLIDFWATWCGPCKIEIPWFIEFQNKYGPQGLQVLGISVDDPAETLVPYVRDMKMNYPVLLGLGQDALFDAYGPMIGLPLTVLVSRDGKICARHVGLTTKEAVEDGIKALL